MNEWDRNQPDRVKTAGGRETLTAFLDYLRETVLWKVEGLSDADARRPLVPSGTSLAGIVKHLAFVERFWFQTVFAGRMVDYPWSEEDPDADWDVADWETLDGICGFYREETAASREIEARAESLESIAAHPGHGMTLRWIVVHMIEETARHAGHADIIRELIDGSAGV
jgi:uncharacterized damage-inducible protein DinB